jgi:SAM-dependent methyltransferase
MRPATRNESFYRTYLKLRGARPPSKPVWTSMNTVLRSREEVGAAIAEAKRAGLFPYYMDVEKTWDSLSALAYILRTTDENASILDAGSSLFSVILPWLYLYRYRKLMGINLSFPGEIGHGSISYVRADVTKSKLRDGEFDAITCLSVVEHVPNLSGFIREMSRLLKPGGPLILSTDYWPVKVRTEGRREFNAPVNVFDEQSLAGLIQIAREDGLELTGEPDLAVGTPVVKWHGLRYTFVVLAFTKVA